MQFLAAGAAAAQQMAVLLCLLVSLFVRYVTNTQFYPLIFNIGQFAVVLVPATVAYACYSEQQGYER